MLDIPSPLSGFGSPFRRRRSFSPAALFTNGEAGWVYDLNDLSTLFQTETTATPVTAQGQSIGRISDKSGNGRHLTQATEANRPPLGSAAGRNVVQWDWVNDFMTYPDFLAANTHTLVFAYDPASGLNAGGVLGITSSFSIAPWALVAESGASSEALAPGGTLFNSLHIGTSAQTVTTRGEVYAAMAAGSVAFWQFTVTSPDDFRRIGAYFGGGSHHAPRFSRALLIDRALTAAERQTITQAWGL